MSYDIECYRQVKIPPCCMSCRFSVVGLGFTRSKKTLRCMRSEMSGYEYNTINSTGGHVHTMDIEGVFWNGVCDNYEPIEKEGENNVEM